MIDYSQFGQALILQKLITDEFPKVVVDVGAHDGISGSNSRRLLEEGWRGVLVEPIPANFNELRKRCGHFPAVTLFQAACSNTNGTARLQIGKDGEHGQMSSLSKNPAIQGNLSAESVEVETMTLSKIFDLANVPLDFGLLLIDTEGHDYSVLLGLKETPARPRIIVTEDLEIETEKYALLNGMRYRLFRRCGPDSIWLNSQYKNPVNNVDFDTFPLSLPWRPSGTKTTEVHAALDHIANDQIEGWIWAAAQDVDESEVVVTLVERKKLTSFSFQAWRTPRPDVAHHFQKPEILMCGYRAQVKMPSGEYDLHVCRQSSDSYAEAIVGSL